MAVASQAAAQQPERIGDFTYLSAVDPMSDMDRSQLSVSSGSRLFPSVLVWRCTGESIQVFLTVGQLINIERTALVQVRFDSDPALPQRPWSLSTDGAAAFATPAITQEFTARARPASRVRLRVWDYQGTPLDREFSLMGLAQGLSRLACASAMPTLEELESGVITKEAAIEGWERTFPHVMVLGNAITKEYVMRGAVCWRDVVDVENAVRFPNFVAARRDGYTRQEKCRPE